LLSLAIVLDWWTPAGAPKFKRKEASCKPTNGNGRESIESADQLETNRFCGLEDDAKAMNVLYQTLRQWVQGHAARSGTGAVKLGVKDLD
jgi:hypothetical protein